MKKEDLKFGNVVETRRELRYLKCDDEKYHRLDGYGEFVIDNSTETLKSLVCRENDIVKVYEDYTLKKVLWERKEFIVSTDEKTILRILPKQFKWIVRTENNELFLYEDKPQKTRYYWESSKGDIENLMVFNHLFEYIKWEDESPTFIENLLKN